MSKCTQFHSITGTWHVRLSDPDHHRSAGRSYCPLEHSGSPRSSDRKWELVRPPPQNSAHRNNTLLNVQPGFQDVSFLAPLTSMRTDLDTGAVSGITTLPFDL